MSSKMKTNFKKSVYYYLTTFQIKQTLYSTDIRDRVMVFNDTFNNISVISWQSLLLVEETGVPWKNHWPVVSHRQTLSHNVVIEDGPSIIGKFFSPLWLTFKEKNFSLLRQTSSYFWQCEIFLSCTSARQKNHVCFTDKCLLYSLCQLPPPPNSPCFSFLK